MNPREVRKLVQLVMDRHYSDTDRIEGFRLHAELHHLTRLTTSERRDRSMREILDKHYTPPQLEAPFPTSHPGWNHKLVPRVRLTWESRGPGLSTPSPNSAFDIEQWARYILYHGRPGCPNPFVGVAFNHAFHIHYRSVFGHLLCCALAPASSVARAIFTRHFACLTAVPRRYRDLVQEWNNLNGQPGDFPDPRPTITLTRMDWTHPDAHTMTVDDVAQLMIDNRVPVSWADHAYTFGLHFLNHYTNGSPESRDLYEAVDDLRIVNLSVWGVPAAIPEWDGWRVPTVEDMDRVRQILQGEERKGIYCTDDSPDWLLVGEDPHFDQLRHRRQPNDPRVHRSPSPPVAGPSTAPGTSEDVHMASVDERSSQEESKASLGGKGSSS
jgi:hypothetical protein